MIVRTFPLRDWLSEGNSYPPLHPLFAAMAAFLPSCQGHVRPLLQAASPAPDLRGKPQDKRLRRLPAGGGFPKSRGPQKKGRIPMIRTSEFGTLFFSEAPRCHGSTSRCCRKSFPPRQKRRRPCPPRRRCCHGGRCPGAAAASWKARQCLPRLAEVCEGSGDWRDSSRVWGL